MAESRPDGAPGALQAFYVRGDDLLSVMRPLVAAPAAAADWQTRYYHADGLGSIRRLTDESGNITDGYTYSAFGELLAHTGPDPQPYAFTGEPLDPNSGFQYHRARWMDPRVGRFAGMDPFEGRDHEPRFSASLSLREGVVHSTRAIRVVGHPYAAVGGWRAFGAVTGAVRTR